MSKPVKKETVKNEIAKVESNLPAPINEMAAMFNTLESAETKDLQEYSNEYLKFSEIGQTENLCCTGLCSIASLEEGKPEGRAVTLVNRDGKNFVNADIKLVSSMERYFDKHPESSAVMIRVVYRGDLGTKAKSYKDLGIYIF